MLGFNLANVSFFNAASHGPEALMAGHPMWLVTAVAIPIIVTLVLVVWFSQYRRTAIERAAL
jgi:heme/copper-type cytochrome/quinol oxidase subunit 2